jgi:hypothetical protein
MELLKRLQASMMRCRQLVSKYDEEVIIPFLDVNRKVAA